MVLKILVWVSAITLWLALALIFVLWAWDLWKDVRLVLSFARAWDKVLRKDGERVWRNPVHRIHLREVFRWLRLGEDFSVTFTDGTRWNSEEARR